VPAWREEPDLIGELLMRARVARQGRDQWRGVGETLALLRELGVSYTRIERETGIPPSTAVRLSHTPRST